MMKLQITIIICVLAISFGHGQFVSDHYIDARLEEINNVNKDVWVDLTVKQKQMLKDYSFPEVKSYFDSLLLQVNNISAELEIERELARKRGKKYNRIHEEEMMPALLAAKTLEEKLEVVRKYPNHFGKREREMAGIKEEKDN